MGFVGQCTISACTNSLWNTQLCEWYQTAPFTSKIVIVIYRVYKKKTVCSAASFCYHHYSPHPVLKHQEAYKLQEITRKFKHWAKSKDNSPQH